MANCDSCSFNYATGGDAAEDAADNDPGGACDRLFLLPRYDVQGFRRKPARSALETCASEASAMFLVYLYILVCNSACFTPIEV